MKKSILLIIITLILNSNSRASSGKTDLLDLGLKGNVKSVRQVSYQALIKADSIIKGKKKLENANEPDFYFVLNEQGNKIQKEEYKSDGTRLRKLTYKYDKHGHVIQENRFNKDDSIVHTSKFEYEYESSGKIIDRFAINPDSTKSRRSTSYFDKKGNLINLLMYKPDSNSDGRVQYSYDDKNRLVSEKWFKPDGSVDIEYTYKYDEKGNQIEEVDYEGEKFLIKYLNTFDDKGNLINIKWVNKNNKVYEEYSFQYVYDPKGNWIKRILFRKNTPKFILEREIAY